MGGWGSGRHWSSKSTTGDFRGLDVRRLQRSGCLDSGLTWTWTWSQRGEPCGSICVRAEVDRVVLIYKTRPNRGEWISQEYPVFLERTRCHYGGQRVWFLCPARNCGRRVAMLYGGTIFACRHCRGLAYQSQRDSRSSRAIDRAWAIRRKTGDTIGSLFDPLEFRPKGMHHRTFARLSAEYERQRYISAIHTARALKISIDEALNG